MTCSSQSTDIAQSDLLAAADRAARAIPPLWPLATSVAVNPFLGQTGESLAAAAARLERVAGAAVTLPRSWFNDRISRAEITDKDLAEALASAPAALRPAEVAALKAAAAAPAPTIRATPTIADLAAEISGIDWPGIIAERLGAWAAGYFDEGQALWVAPRGRAAYGAWRAVATHDLTPEILGLAGFARHVADAPETAPEALRVCVEQLALPAAALETYFHQMLTTLGGWGQAARYRLWQAELAGGTDQTLTDLLTIRLIWETALLDRYQARIGARWQAAIAVHAAPVAPGERHVIDMILQEAAERSAQRRLAETLAETPDETSTRSPTDRADLRPALQAAFCIDVRSEVFRRALEALSPDIQTLGFAGFFGLTTSHRRFASDVEELRLPVLLNPGLASMAGGPDLQAKDQDRRFKARASRAWGRFKLAAVSSFAFVEATGPLYAAKLLDAALARPSGGKAVEPAPHLTPDPALADKINMAATVLRAMSLTSGFARLVLLVGHGANVVNNPLASALHCGACGGHAGDVNARLLASLLNAPEVRDGVAVQHGIRIPNDTWFVGALHDTTTDAVQLYHQDDVRPGHAAALTVAQHWLEAAGTIARTERALRLPRSAGGEAVARRSRDWAEVRPEWGLAGCQAFIAAPRSRTQGRNLRGQAFLHDYDWSRDEGFSVLELIMTAPVVVASWISLQYYGSVVAPTLFGGGDKLLHNVAGGMGVIEGNGGPLRGGLPWQSVHDGQRLMHEPLRLAVCIEAPREAMSEILARHQGVRDLFDHRWLHLFALDEAGRMAWRYAGDLAWTPCSPPDSASSAADDAPSRPLAAATTGG